MTNTEWLSNLKAGDKVAIPLFYSGLKLGTVKRTTKTLIILESGHKYAKSNGHGLPRDKWHPITIEPYTPEAAEEIERIEARAKTKQFWEGLKERIDRGKVLNNKTKLELFLIKTHLEKLHEVIADMERG